ncbi:MAG: hypothetical protein ACRDQZ_02985 [Mycobacteriales bacterium]
MSRPTELTESAVGGTVARAALAARGMRLCEHCERPLPLTVSRCRRRTCPGYSETWARDTMRKSWTNLDVYGGLAAMLTLTAPGEAAGLPFDRALCTHPPNERCDGKKKGCKVFAGAAKQWNDLSRAWWRDLNRVCKQRADRALRKLGADHKGGLLLYQWELQGRGVWHLHFVVGLETAVERAWAIEYVKAMRELGPRYGFGFVDAKPMRSPRPASQCAGYISKYLVKRGEAGSFEATETVKAAGRTLLNYVSRRLTARSLCTMRMLRLVRVAWAWRNGLIPDPPGDPLEFLVAVSILEQGWTPTRAP